MRKVNFTKIKIFFISILFTACGGSCGDNDTGGGGPATNYVEPYVGNTQTQWQSVANANLTARLLTPEQISNQLSTTLGVELGWEDDYGNFNDIITQLYAVPLGGVDYLTSSNRDYTPKVNNLLLVRSLAFHAAAIAVNNEAADDAGDPVIFTECNVRQDRPYMESDSQYPAAFQQQIREGEQRWQNQLVELYFRVYARAPTQAEIDAIRQTFIDVVTEQEWPPAGWMIVLYSMLSTAEFWNI